MSVRDRLLLVLIGAAGVLAPLVVLTAVVATLSR